RQAQALAAYEEMRRGLPPENGGDPRPRPRGKQNPGRRGAPPPEPPGGPGPRRPPPGVAATLFGRGEGGAAGRQERPAATAGGAAQWGWRLRQSSAGPRGGRAGGRKRWT